MNPDSVILAPLGLEDVLSRELGDRILGEHGRLFLVHGKQRPYFAQNIWLNPKIEKFKSIGDAAKILRRVQRNWWLHSIGHHRRATLIEEQLPPLKPKPMDFLAAVPKAPLGSWTLLDEATLLYSAECSSPFPDGELHFQEDRDGPPSRAYLKLWELFTLTGKYPQSGEKVVDLGSSPGGWTWVLDQLGCEVLSVDKAPLDPKSHFSKNVKYLEESAFALSPQKLDWLFSDVICYPDRLLELVKKWEPLVPNLVCTIKFQGETDFRIIERFLEIKGSEIRHLSCNKHELTWSRIHAH